MPAESITLKLPMTLAEELSSASQDFLIDILERGLRERKIDRALEKYQQGEMSLNTL